MHVLHLHSGNQFGGIERLLVTLAQYGGQESRLHHSFALCFEGRLAAELRHHHAPVRSLGAVRVSRPHRVLRARRAFRRLLAETQPDIVVTHAPWSRVVGGPALRAGRTHDVLWIHGIPAARTWLDWLAARYPPEGVIYNSHFTAKAGSARYSGVPSRTLYCPVDLAPPQESRCTVRRRYATEQSSVVIVQISRLDASKGHLDLIDAARLLPTALPWVIWFVGGPHTAAQRRYHEQLQQRVGRCGLAPRVRFLGEVSDISSVLYASDILCHPSRTGESFGLVFVEGMRAGLPVVTTDMGAATEIVSPDCGVVVPALDPPALADALAGLAASPSHRLQAAAAGRARADAIANPRERIADLHEVLGDLTNRSRRC